MRRDRKTLLRLDTLQIRQMEHGFNASTFAARVVAFTLAPLSTSLSAAVGALSGPLHGGADEAAYRMALAIGSPERAAAWVACGFGAPRKKSWAWGIASIAGW